MARLIELFDVSTGRKFPGASRGVKLKLRNAGSVLTGERGFWADTARRLFRAGAYRFFL
jgi:hypothetical protein